MHWKTPASPRIKKAKKLKSKLKVVVRNSIDPIDTVSIRYLGIDIWHCHWNSDQKCKKKMKIENGKNWEMDKCRRKLRNSKSESLNTWLTKKSKEVEIKIESSGAK